MKFVMTKIAALAAMAIASSGAHAVLTSFNTLSIENDAVTSYDISNTSFHASSNGDLLDSFFTAGGSTKKQVIDSQFAYLYSGAAFTLTGPPSPISPLSPGMESRVALKPLAPASAF